MSEKKKTRGLLVVVGERADVSVSSARFCQMILAPVSKRVLKALCFFNSSVITSCIDVFDPSRIGIKECNEEKKQKPGRK